jgi:hypothetical protein
MSLRGLILLIGLLAIFAVQSYASGAKWERLGAHHLGGAAAALILLWVLVSI